MTQHNAAQQTAKSRGQSLVEVALFLPIFLIIIAGLVEVSQLALGQNRLSNATRVGARFGANGGEDEGILNITMNAITQTLEVDEALWDIWVIRVAFDANGNILQDQWEFTHVYGLSQTVAYSTVVEANIQTEVRQELYTDQNLGTDAQYASNLEAVGVLALHDVQSILGLNALPALQGMHSIRSLNLMRISGLKIEQTNGCSAFPIAVEDGIRNVTRDTFPAPGDFQYPSGSDVPVESDFPNNDWDAASTDLRNATEGTLFFIQQGHGPGNFGWLRWNTGRTPSANTLAPSLTFPGDSNDYTDHGDGGQPVAGSDFNYVVRGFIDAVDPADQSLHVNDWVAANNGAVASVGASNGNPMVDLVDGGKAIRVIVWDSDGTRELDNQGRNARYLVSGFMIVRLHGYRLNQGGGGSWILAEFIRWDTSCGQETPTQ